jgi:LmbE family N-acetylglucosaminyl deacetylase
VNVSCVIAAYNEERTVARVIEAARAVQEVEEIVVVSDGSVDATAEAAAGAGADLIVQLPKNLGKGGAILAGARRASGSLLLLLDADLENLNPREISALIHPVLYEQCDMAVGVMAEDLGHAVWPYLSGIRVVLRDVLLDHPDLGVTRYRFELALTDLARKQHWIIRRVPLTGVKHIRKEEKYGLIQAYRGKVRMTLDMLGLSRGRRNGASRSRTRILAATGLVVMLAHLSMGLFTATTAVGSALDVFPEPTGSDRYLIVAAHADDELLAAGGLMQRALAAGADVWVVFATNGDGNRLAAVIGGRRLRPRPADFIAEGKARQREAQTALGRLGVPADHIMFLGYPDRGLMALAAERRDPEKPYVSPYTKASTSPYPLTFRPMALYTGTDVESDLEAILTVTRPTVILTHHEADRHSDHQALNLFVRQAIRSLVGRGVLQHPQLYTYLVHAWDFPRPLRYAPDQPLLPPRSLLESSHWVRFELTADELAAKQAAMRDYRSQLDSPYLRLLLNSFLRQNELFAATEP